jgi:hypothetical protein
VRFFFSVAQHHTVVIQIAFQHHDNSVHVEEEALGQMSQRLNARFY